MLTLASILNFVVASLAATTVCITITKTRIFREPRQFLADTYGDDSLIYNLFSCPYCLGHWVTAAIVFLIDPIEGLTIYQRILHWLTMVYVVGMFSGLMHRMYIE